MTVLLLVAILLHQIAATWVAHRERRRLELAALARTPAEFRALLSRPRGTLEP